MPPELYAMQLDITEPKRTIPSAHSINFLGTITNTGKKEDVVDLKADVMLPSDEEDAPEWQIKFSTGVAGQLPTDSDDPFWKRLQIAPGGKRMFNIDVTSPHSVKYGQTLRIVITATSESDPAVTETETLVIGIRQSIMAVKTSIGHERAVADNILLRCDQSKDVGLFSILAPATLRGYVLIEAMNTDRLKELIRGIKRARGIVEGETSFEEISHYLTPKPLVSGIVVGDIVELVAGPFKGEKARVQQIDVPKEEITVELFEAVVPIPVTVRGDSVRVLDSKDR